MFTNKVIYTSIFLFFVTVSGIFSQQRLPVAGMRPLEMKISGDGKHIVAAYDSCTIVWDISKREILRRIPRNLSYYPPINYTIQAFNQDGSMLAIGDNRILSLYNTENNKLIKQLPVFENRENPNKTDSHGLSTMIAWKQENFKQFYFTPDKKNIIVISDEDKIRYVDLIRGTTSLVNVSDDIPSPSYKGDILDINISYGRAVFRQNFSVIIFNLFSGQKEGEIFLKYNNTDFNPISFSLSGNKNKHSVLLAGNRAYENYLFICDIENRKILNGKKIDGNTHIVKLTTIENVVAFARDDSICLYNFQTGTEIARLVAYEETIVPVASQTNSTLKEAVFRTLQLGSFSSFNEALHMVSVIEDEGFRPIIECSKENNLTFWRVVINDVLESRMTTIYELLKNAGISDIWIRPVS